MQFQHYDLGVLSNSQSVEVELCKNAANVKLLDAGNFQKYRRGEKYRYYGGYVTKSPFIIPIPHSSHWHVAIDLGGYAGQVSSSIQVLGG